MALLLRDPQGQESPLWSLVDKKGQNVFRAINTELVCNECLQLDSDASCSHRMAMHPPQPWKPTVDDSDAAFCPEFGFACLTVTQRTLESNVCESCKSVSRYVFTWGCVCCMVKVCLACHVHAIIPEDEYRPIVCRECRFCDPETNPCTNAVTDRDE